jgi:hypothetical protein
MNSKITILSLFTAGILTQNLAIADDLALAISDNAININYESMFDKMSTQATLLHANADNISNSDTKDPTTWGVKVDAVTSDLLGYGLFANGKTGSIRTRLGGKAFYLDTESGDAMHGLAFGGGVDTYLGPNIFFTVDFMYAPDIVTGGDFNHYQDLNAQVTFQVLKTASIFLGYRDVQVDFEIPKKYSRNIYQGPFVGFHFKF